MSIYPKEGAVFEPSDASGYIDELIQEGKAHLTPDRLRGKPVGWTFFAKTDEFLGYDAYPGEKITSIDLDHELPSTRGEYRIEKVGPAEFVLFKGQVGNAPERQFVFINKISGNTRLGFIHK